MVFSNGDLESIAIINNVLHIFQHLSGLTPRLRVRFSFYFSKGNHKESDHEHAGLQGRKTSRKVIN